MDNRDDSENNAKVSDSAYSNSCSNSQSRRSHSSKSTHSGSNSSGSSGYGGKPSTSNSNDLGQQKKKEKEPKKKKQPLVQTLIPNSWSEGECRPQEATNIPSAVGGTKDVSMPLPSKNNKTEKDVEHMDVSTPGNNSAKDESTLCNIPMTNTIAVYPVERPVVHSRDGFSCLVSMHDGVVMYTTSSLTTTLGFPKDMWIGKSFIDFVHPNDRNTFASQITTGLIPKIINQSVDKAQTSETQESTMVCRIRRYRGLSSGFSVKQTAVSHMPFLLKFSFKNVTDEEGTAIYLVIQTTPFFSAFNIPNETFTKVLSFTMRHNANGILEYMDLESVPYLGYLPQDIINTNVLMLYHPDDLVYLQEVYEFIVKEGSVPRSKPYRILVQNGSYMTVETDWTAFINPWSRKLEFITGKHYIIQGPQNPHVFQLPDPEKALKLSEEDKNKAQTYMDNIIKTMKEVLTKPAEIAKQQMSKRCQELALFMESLMEEQPKGEEDLRIEIQDVDNSFCERDSVMLGGISPHHEYKDSTSSTETPLSYNQLNFNDNLQRYFNSHQPNAFVDSNSVPSGYPIELSKQNIPTSKCLTPVALNSGDSGELTSSGESGGLAVVVDGSSPVLQFSDHQHMRLTESLLSKHNAEMEKKLLKVHREHRFYNKGEREKVSNHARQKKKEHLARCNAAFQINTGVSTTDPIYKKPQGIKRSSKQPNTEEFANKYHCPSSRQMRRNYVTSTASESSLPTNTITVAPHWPTTPLNNMNTCIVGVSLPPQISIMNPLSAVSGMVPMYYTPANTVSTTEVSPSNPNVQQNNNNQQQFASIAPCMMYGSPIYGPPIIYSPINPQSSYFPQTLMSNNMYYNNALNPLCLANSNYEEACKTSIPPTRLTTSARRDKISAERLEKQAIKNDQKKNDPENASQNLDSGSQVSQNENKQAERMYFEASTSNSFSSKTAPFASSASQENKRPGRLRDEPTDKTDVESSYSSFYSSFFRTESGSAEDSGDLKKTADASKTNIVSYKTVTPKRKADPPWTEQVCVTSELIYKYQITSKNLEDVLTADHQKIKLLEQPSLVNEQLGQLYLDLQLEGVAARLTLEEGITSSSSSGDETSAKSKIRKREYSKMTMIHEENAPLPSPIEDAISVSSNSVS